MPKKKTVKKVYILAELHTIKYVAEAVEFYAIAAKILPAAKRRKRRIEINFRAYLDCLSFLEGLLSHLISKIRQIRPEVILYESAPAYAELERAAHFQLSEKAGNLLRGGEIYELPEDVRNKFLSVIDKFVTYHALKFAYLPTGTDGTYELLGKAWQEFDIQGIVHYGVLWEKEALQRLAKELEQRRERVFLLICGSAHARSFMRVLAGLPFIEFIELPKNLEIRDHAVSQEFKNELKRIRNISKK